MAPQSDNGTHGLRNAGDDAFQLTIDYLKQETLQPLKGVGRFLSMGIAASFCWAVGLLLILIGVLRLLQTETGTALMGDWSWVPYAVAVVLGVIVIAAAAWRITATTGKQRVPAGTARRPTATVPPVPPAATVPPVATAAAPAVSPTIAPTAPPTVPLSAAPPDAPTETQTPPVPPVPPTPPQEGAD